MNQTACTICQMVLDTPSDALIYENDCWVAGVLPALKVPGWIVLALRRHAEGPAPLTTRETESLGVVLAPLMDALAEVTGAERVYLQAYGEREPHWHLLLSSRGADIPPEHRHVQFFINREKYTDDAHADVVAHRLRDAMRDRAGAGAGAGAPAAATLGR